MPETRTRALSFSSEKAVVQRWFGGEILDHSPESVRMDFLKSGRAPLLLNHDGRSVIGVLDSAFISKDRVGRGVARFGRSASAEDALRNVDDRILVNTSVGYRVHEMRLESSSDSEDIYRVMDWEPFEASLVGVPADTAVGVGRADEAAEVRSLSNPAQPAETGATTMEGNDAAAGASAETAGRASGGDNQALRFEQMRQRAIENLCKANRIDDKTKEHWVGQGLSIDEVTEDLLKVVQERSAKLKPKSYLGLSAADTQRFSLVRAVLAAQHRDWTQAGFELDCVRELAKREQKVLEPNVFLVPYDILERQVPVPRAFLKRDMTVGTAAQGGYLVETENVGFIEMLRNRSVAYRMGARRLPGLVGNITIPRQSGAATAGWLANEAATISETNQTLQQVALSPKTVGAYTEVSRQLMMQSQPAAEGLVTSDLAIVAALAVDAGILNGSGASGQPTGIINTAGVGAVTGTSLAFDDILEFQTDVAGANVMPVSGGYATTPAVASLCIQRVKYASTASPLWEGSIWDGQMQGFPAMSSLQVPAATMLFGDWAQVIVGEWGNLEITVNPYANFVGLLTGIRAVVTIDVALRYAGAFSIAASIT